MVHEIQTFDGKLLADPIEGLCSGPVVNQNWLVTSAIDLSTDRFVNSSTDQPVGQPVASMSAELVNKSIQLTCLRNTKIFALVIK